MYDVIKMQGKNAVGTLKGEFTKTPDQLNEKQLKQANWLANLLTAIRRVVYFIMPVFGIMAAIVFAGLFDSSNIFTTILWILFAIYTIFKARDLLRGKI